MRLTEQAGQPVAWDTQPADKEPLRSTADINGAKYQGGDAGVSWKTESTQQAA